MSYSVATASQILRDAVQHSFRKYSLWYLIQGVLIALTGILAIAFPAVTTFAVVGFLGWLLIFGGVLQAVGLFGSRSTQAFPLQIVSSVLFIVVGMLFLRNPADSVLTLSVLLVVLLLVQGLSRILFALTIRPLRHWVWVLASGVVAVGLALVLWLGMPVTALWLIGASLGAALVSEGVALALLAWHIRSNGVTPAA